MLVFLTTLVISCKKRERPERIVADIQISTGYMHSGYPIMTHLDAAKVWDAFCKVFAEYSQLSPNERPKNDDEKRDHWSVRLSRTVGRNLSRFFEAWGIPVSEQAKRAVADLPEWMPENFPPK